MRLMTFILAILLFTSTASHAELPLEELWSIELDSATALGNAWTDEGGNSNVVVGDGWRAHLISNGETIWSSDSLIGPVTAVLRVAYSDGEQILVAASEPLPDPHGEDWDSLAFGHLFRFGGDELIQLSDQQLLDGGQVFDNVFDNRNLTKLTIMPEMLEDDEHPVLAAWSTSSWGFFDGDRISGNLGIITEHSYSFRRSGSPVEVEVFQDSDNQTRVAQGWYRWYDENGREFGEYTCDVRLFDADLAILETLVLAEHEFPTQDRWRPPVRRPELLGMTVVQSEDQTSIFAAYSDTSNAFLCELSTPELEVLQTRSLPNNWQGGQMLCFKWEDVNASNLLLIDSRGNVLVFDSGTLTQIESGNLPGPYVASVKTDFEDDGNQELLTLTRGRLICYSISPLDAPPVGIVAQPATFIFAEPYPNPFNSQTTLDYRISQSGNVSICLYNLQGQQIAELVNSSHPTGQYSATFHAGDLASGVYVVRMMAEGETEARKVVLMR